MSGVLKSAEFTLIEKILEISTGTSVNSIREKTESIIKVSSREEVLYLSELITTETENSSTKRQVMLDIHRSADRLSFSSENVSEN